MALALNSSYITLELASLISKKCVAKASKSQYEDNPDPIYCFEVAEEEGIIYVPLGIWKDVIDEENLPVKYPKTNVTCKKKLYTLETDPKGYRDQDVVFEEALVKLENDRVLFLALSTGFGKTTLGNYFACYTKLKTAVLCHIDKVNEQWIEEFTKFTNAKVQRVKGSKPIDPNADVYIIGVQKASKIPREQLSHIGLVIFDEAHVATVTAFKTSLLRFQPKYVIGLSATPRRADGLHKLLTMYFGPRKEFIHRQEVKEFTVYKVNTPFKPSIKYTMVKGVMVPDWCHIVNSIEYNEERHDYIVKLIMSHPNHKILVLSGRQNQSKSIYKKAVEAGEKSIKLLIGTTKDDGISKRVTIAGTKKAGTGYDDPELNMLIIASDCKNVEQWEGRLRTVGCIIFTLIDDYKTFENHWKIQEAWFLKKGATIENIELRQNIKVGILKKRMIKPK
ncbi:MAG TPA: DEAD/DEAH box helicase family protein [Saprospiraceae bacterium]|nr:DEAD/DEAH box helicase family protein [Saprospiraceae bacterium]